MARAGLAVIAARDAGVSDRLRGAKPDKQDHPSVDAVIARAAVAFSVLGESALSDAVDSIDQALISAPPGNSGWVIPIEPLLGVHARPDVWAPVLARLRTRAA
jgi:hypothetical protein